MNLQKTLCVLLVVVGCLSCNPRAAAAGPNILLVLSDDHSAPHVGCYGNENAVTPNLDAFADQGMLFERAYTTAPQCAPSRASIFGGRSPVALRVTRFTQPAPKDTVFFTDVLREHGYWVGLDGRHHHLDGRRRGQDHEDAALRAADLKYLDEKFDHVAIHGTGSDPSRWFQAALDKIPHGKPFFLYFGFNQPHRGYRPVPASAADTFDSARLKLPPDFPDLPEVRVDYAEYLHEVHTLDKGFGNLMRVLEQRGLAENTLVVFMGDNGEALLRGKGTLYERGCHVPLIVRWPGRVQAGSRSDVLVSGEDLACTLLQAAGLPVPDAMTGTSFLPALQGRPYQERQYVYAERGWHWGPITRTDGLDLSRSITSKRYRLIFNLLPDRPYTPVDMVRVEAWRAIVDAHQANTLSPLHQRLIFPEPRRPIFELYDLSKDPYELENLAGQPSMHEVETQLRIELAKWMIREGDFLPIPSLTYPEHHEFQ